MSTHGYLVITNHGITKEEITRKVDESWFRWMEYYDAKSSNKDSNENLWLGDHQDLTGRSRLFSQPMSTLQLRSYEDEAQWKYIPHIPGAIIVNAGELMTWWTGDYFKAAVHRVVQPRPDQRGHNRGSTFYFVAPTDDVVINNLLEEGPVLRNAGVKKWLKDGDAPTSKAWVNNRVKVTGEKTLFQDGDDNSARWSEGLVLFPQPGSNEIMCEFGGKSATL